MNTTKNIVSKMMCGQTMYSLESICQFIVGDKQKFGAYNTYNVRQIAHISDVKELGAYNYWISAKLGAPKIYSTKSGQCRPLTTNSSGGVSVSIGGNAIYINDYQINNLVKFVKTHAKTVPVKEEVENVTTTVVNPSTRGYVNAYDFVIVSKSKKVSQFCSHGTTVPQVTELLRKRGLLDATDVTLLFLSPSANPVNPVVATIKLNVTKTVEVVKTTISF